MTTPNFSAQPLLEVQSVSLQRQDKAVLSQVSVSVPFGAHIALVGPNGSGKTSLLQVMAGRLQPSAGRVLVGGQDLAQMPGMQRARQLAVVHQHEQVHGQLRVRDYVALGRTPYPEASRDENTQVVSDALQRCRLDGLQDRLMRSLSGGEQQRAAIARAIAQQPRILLLDEPTNHLDLRTRADMLDLLTGLGVTVVAALHELSLVQRFAHRVLLLGQGRVVAEDLPSKVLTKELVLGNFGMDVFYLPLPHRAHEIAVFESPQTAHKPLHTTRPHARPRAH
ncbi:iron complex transport system ATP-binding protein [Rhodoferax ferrireducens]|uniref:Iron complex transport system ATP-binding protein n=1 Tax=Rhodoferax ferrireducens TaxID=192843 RepID=A0ABU2CDL5_9BURK|nr:ABC transporter ATP-binding protein [Rhodoferax ferrireducens]MDR7379413.1 iron complex transport system ATP-binding protein [Rhodoferax ferrireducens]